jgi:transposase
VTDAPPEEPPADPRDVLIGEQAERIAAPEVMVAGLREQLAAAQRAGSGNSGNSSMPPSADDLPGRTMPRKQRRAAERASEEKKKKRKRGKQPGSPGAAMAWEIPDRAEDHYPQGECACGRDLADAADLGVDRSYQQGEIPVPPAERVQHDLRKAKCACRRTHVAARPAAVPDSALSIGPRLRALAVLPGRLPACPGAAVPGPDRRRDRRRRIGRVHPFLPALGGGPGRGRGAADPHPGHRRSRGGVRRDYAAVRSGREKKYVHGAFTEEYSAFWLGARSLDSMEDAGILPDFAGIVVSDRYQNYFHPRWEHIAGNQACLAHYLRDYQDCAETYPGAIWPVQAQRALRGLIHAWHAAREQGLPAVPAGAAGPLVHEFRHAVLAGVPRVPGPKNSTRQRPGRELLEFCRDRRDDVLRFTGDTRIWPTNNRSASAESAP